MVSVAFEIAASVGSTGEENSHSQSGDRGMRKVRKLCFDRQCVTQATGNG